MTDHKYSLDGMAGSDFDVVNFELSSESLF
jgi:hypothetical protein